VLKHQRKGLPVTDGIAFELNMSRFTYKVACLVCGKKFNTVHQLSVHSKSSKHKISSYAALQFFACDDGPINLPQPKQIPRRSVPWTSYTAWLQTVADRINNSLHPRAKGNKIS